MSGVGSTNAMKKGSANNPFLAYSEADMASFLNSAYTGCIVKYVGEPISRYLTEQNKTVPEHVKNLVFSPTDGGFWTFFDKGNMRIKIQQKTNGSTKTLYITPGRFYNLAWHFNKNDFTNGNLYLTDSLTSPTEIPTEIQKYFSTEPYWRWNKECVNDQGNLTIWTYDQDVTFTIEQATTSYGIAYDYTHGITIVPYKVNELYKVVYGDGEYYYEEFCHISDTRTTANSDYIAPGKTAFDFTGNLQTGTGSKINPYLAYTVEEFQSFPVGSFIKWLGPGKTVIDATTGQMLMHGEVYRAVEDGDILQYVILPTLTNEATAEDVTAGKEFINGNGQKVTGNSQVTEITEAFKNIISEQSSDNLYEISEDALKGISTIMNSAFSRRLGLKKISLPDSITSIGNSAFSSCKNLQTFKAHSLKIIPERCFESVPLMSIDVPNVITIEGAYSMGYNSFVNADLEFPKVTTVGQSAFYDCKCKSLSFPSIVTSFGGFNLYYNENLESVNLPLLEVAPTSYFLYDCRNIPKITLPKLKSLELGSIQACTLLKTIDLSSVTSLTSTSSNAFGRMSDVRLLLRYEGVVTLSGSKGIPSSITEIYVPDDQVENYKTASAWSAYSDRIKPLSEFVE